MKSANNAGADQTFHSHACTLGHSSNTTFALMHRGHDDQGHCASDRQVNDQNVQRCSEGIDSPACGQGTYMMLILN